MRLLGELRKANVLDSSRTKVPRPPDCHFLRQALVSRCRRVGDVYKDTRVVLVCDSCAWCVGPPAETSGGAPTFVGQ